MKVDLFPFQKLALARLRQSSAVALGNYRSTHTPQVVSFTAPTGAGKTIIMASLIEAIFYGDENYPDQPEAIFVWLSDSPQLNEQSKLKIDLKADKIRLNQCVTIDDDSFDREYLEDGHIYFLNTQKLGKNSNLTRHSDGRQYTIWETLANTVHNKSDRLYFIIDEAHRGAQKAQDLAKATTIMQKFLKGSDADRLPPMPVVIGMTATSQRFNRLAEGIHSTTHYVITTADEVRASGLLKDRIIITYPETDGNDMAVLQAAADEWKNKWLHWAQYSTEQHDVNVNPIFVIQVQNGNAHQISTTDLNECLRCVEERTKEKFCEGEVVHAFGEGTSTLQINGMNVPYVEPSRIADDKRIKIVLFKETLSTGWDCPRAETMMSFRHATDYTYVAQLLGRMVRTPLQRHINVDDTLNDVHLYLPQFNENTVKSVVDALRSTEGANIPTDIEAEEMNASQYDILTLRPTYTTQPRVQRDKNIQPGQVGVFFNQENENPDVQIISDQKRPIDITHTSVDYVQTPVTTYTEEAVTSYTPPVIHQQEPTNKTSAPDTDIDREAVVKAINDTGLLTYNVRKVMNTDYLKSLYSLIRFLSQNSIDQNAKPTVIKEITEKIHKHIDKLKAEGKYSDLAEKVLQFKLSAQIFDVFGRSIDNYEIHDMFSTTDTDLERQFRLAEAKLGNEGVGKAYLKEYYNTDSFFNLEIHVIVFAASAVCMNDLQNYAKDKFHELNDENRRKTINLKERFKKKYDDIVSDGDMVSKHNFRLPETIRVPHETEGKLYSNHLFVDDSGTAMINLNNWERKVIEEEEKRDDFVCWLRNPPRGSWSLCIPYEMDGDKRPMYPDFLIIRKDGSDYIIDVLEPHNPSMVDNLGKAKGLAEYARLNPGAGRIQLIRMKKNSLGQEQPFRLDMSKSSIRDKVIHCISNDELNHIFDDYGF